MPEPRLAVCTPDQSEVDGVAVRLRGASVEHRASGSTIAGFDAVVVRDGSRAKELLVNNARVLLVADPCPSESLLTSNEPRLSIVNPDRYLPSRQLIRSQLPSKIGEPGLVRVHRWQPMSTKVDVVAGIPEPLLRDIDVVLWLASKLPDRVYAVEHKSTLQGRYVQVHLGFPGGGMAMLDYDGRLPIGDGYQSLSVIASSGAAYADDHQNTQLVYNGGQPRAVRTEERARQLTAIVQDFVDSMNAGRTSMKEDWRRVFVVADAIGRSLKSQSAIALEGS